MKSVPLFPDIFPHTYPIKAPALCLNTNTPQELNHDTETPILNQAQIVVTQYPPLARVDIFLQFGSKVKILLHLYKISLPRSC